MRPVRVVAAGGVGRGNSVEAAQTKEELRGGLLESLIAGNARWLDAAGLSATLPRAHARMLRTLADVRRHDSFSIHTGVIDWSTVQDCAADGIALFPLLAIALRQSGTRVVCCAPDDTSLADALQSLSFLTAEVPRWVKGRQGDSRGESVPAHWRASGWKARSAQNFVAAPSTTRLVLPSSGVFDPHSRAARTHAGNLCDSLGDAAVTMGIAADVADRATAVAREAIANLRHSRAKHASIVAIADGGRGRVELAVADDGVGIARTMSEKLPGANAMMMPDRYWVAEALVGLAPGTAYELDRRHGARGFARTLAGLLEAGEARALIRSGGVSVAVDRNGVLPTVVGSTSRGFGTQVLLRLAA